MHNGYLTMIFIFKIPIALETQKREKGLRALNFYKNRNQKTNIRKLLGKLLVSSRNLQMYSQIK
jgi:hypothetical protein